MGCETPLNGHLRRLRRRPIRRFSVARDGLGESRVRGCQRLFGPSDIERKVRFAQSWLSERREQLRRELCGDVRARLEQGGFDMMTDAATVADAIAAVLGKPPANIVAVILLR